MDSKIQDYIDEVELFSAHHYHPIPVVISHGEGCWATDIQGRKYLDMLSAYSALNQGHRHPKIIAAAKKQMDSLTLTSCAFHNDQMGKFLHRLTSLIGYDKALLMNTGAEAVETAIKASRRWGYKVKSVPANQAEIIVCANNFHGRTTTIVGFSSNFISSDGFGAFSTGFKMIPYGDSDALEKAINPNTVGFLVEPIQGEAGVIVPPKNYLKKCREITKNNNVLLITDEIQTGLGRTGKLFCYEHDQVRPDIVIVGKALGGGVYPVSAILADDQIMLTSFEPGSHGSTFGGNPLGCAIANTALDVIIDEKLPERSRELGDYFLGCLNSLDSPVIKEVRGKGLLVAIELYPKAKSARYFAETLLKEGILAKETHDVTIRFAPPLIISKEEIDWAMERIKKFFQ